MLKARKILKNFNPEVAIGVGGYASGPTLKAAAMRKIPTVVQEQNSFPGKTNKLLAKNVDKLCVAYEGLERFFPAEKIVLTGNPVRLEVVQIDGKRDEAFKFYDLDSTKKTILIIGGSLGARTLNESMLKYLSEVEKQDIQVVWQCGKLYHSEIQEKLKDYSYSGLKCVQFIEKMDYAYAIADVVISRAGAISVSELCLIGKPTILVPSPNVSEDHQTHNAMSLVNKVAALLVKDTEAREMLIPTAIKLLNDDSLKAELSQNILSLAKPNATKDIVQELNNLVESGRTNK